MTTPPDPTGLRRLVAAIENPALHDRDHECQRFFLECRSCVAEKELGDSLAAVRVADLERVVASARQMVFECMLGDECYEDLTKSQMNAVFQLRQALAALDAGAKEVPNG